MQNQTPYSTSPSSSRPPTATTPAQSVLPSGHTTVHPQPTGPNQREAPYDPYPHPTDSTQTQEEDFLSDMQQPVVTQSQMDQGYYETQPQYYGAEEGEYVQYQQDGQYETDDHLHRPLPPHETQAQYEHQRYPADYRGPTPDSEVGDGALTIWKNAPADQGEYGPEGYRINQYATQRMMGGGPGGDRVLQPQASIRQQDYVEEPASPMGTFQSTQYQDPNPPLTHPQPNLPAQKIASAGASRPFHPPGPSTKSPAVDQTEEGPSGPNKRKNEEAHVGRENIAGRRVLTKRSGSKRDLFTHMDEEEDEEERRVERRAAAVEEFDPTAPIIKFDTNKELVEEWGKIQGDIVPFLEKYCADKLNQTYNEIYMVVQLFQQLNDDARKDLTEGVAAIEEEEVKQEEARKVIVDFATAMQEVADKLASFGGGGIKGLPLLNGIADGSGGGGGGTVQA